MKKLLNSLFGSKLSTMANQLIYQTLVLFGLVHLSSNEIFTSIEHMKNVLSLENAIARNLKSYIHFERERLARIER